MASLRDASRPNSKARPGTAMALPVSVLLCIARQRLCDAKPSMGNEPFPIARHDNGNESSCRVKNCNGRARQDNGLQGDGGAALIFSMQWKRMARLGHAKVMLRRAMQWQWTELQCRTQRCRGKASLGKASLGKVRELIRTEMHSTGIASFFIVTPWLRRAERGGAWNGMGKSVVIHGDARQRQWKAL